MALPIPNLDDKLFTQLVEEARSLLPSRSPEWTDHNVHDPGITFLELFAWLAEMQRYRLSRTSAASAARFFRLAGTPRRGIQPATTSVAMRAVAPEELVPSGTRLVAIGKEETPFETLGDTMLTPAEPKKVITRSGDREIVQTAAEMDEAGHYEPFGERPAIGDSLQLGFEHWFGDAEYRLTIELFESDLPGVVPLSDDAPGFVPSASVRWEFQNPTGEWQALPVIQDETLQFSRSGDLLFRSPGPAQKRDGLFWLRATIISGRFEIAPRVSMIRTNTVRARQVETIPGEILGQGLGTPDQLVQLRKRPVLVESGVSAGRFEIGEVLDWQAMVMRLAKPQGLPGAGMMAYIAGRLGPEAAAILAKPELTDRTNPGFRKPSPSELYTLARAFDALLADSRLFQDGNFSGFVVSEEFTDVAAGKENPCACSSHGPLAQFNRRLLQFVFGDLMLSDRIEIQVGTDATVVEDEPKTWTRYTQVDDFSKSGPADRHVMIDPVTGEVLFGNGLNGRVPQIGEKIRARFYRYSRGAEGNIAAHENWLLATGARGSSGRPATGGAAEESFRDTQFRARKELQRITRALTAQDFETLALATPGLRVARAKVLLNYSPVVPCVEFPGDVAVVVLPFVPAGGSAPEPGEGFQRTVQNHLESRRPVTTNIRVIAPDFVDIDVAGKVVLKKGASTEDARREVDQALRLFLDPVRGGPEREGWSFGRDVFPAEVYQLLAKVTGVEYASGVSLNGKRNQAVQLPRAGLPRARRLQIDVIPFERRSELEGAG